MPRHPSVPAYREHRQSGQAVVTLTDAVTGRRHDVLLGTFGSAASRAEYQRVILEWEANGRRPPQAAAAPADVTVSELADRYWTHVQEYYRHPDGTQTGEVVAMKYAIRPINHLHGEMHAKDYGPLALKAVRELLLKGYEHPRYGRQRPVCRTQINARIKRIRRMFKWGVSNELVPAFVLHGLQAVEALKRGRTKARESEPVLPVARAVVEDTLPLLRPMLAAMVRLQLESGMRPGEVVVMRACDLDMTGAVWLYRLEQHKTLHHGFEKIVALGPRCQEVIRRYLTTNTQARLFSPKLVMEERAETMRASRKTRVQPSQVNRKKAKPAKKPGEFYTTLTYGRAIAEAIKRHNRDKPESERIPHWHPHQLRKTRAKELKREVGLDTARAILGHRSPALTEMYAGLDTEEAVKVMSRLG